MTAVTISTAGTYDLATDASFSGRLAGEQITLNAASILSITADVSIGITGGIPLLGTIRINRGKKITDARGIRLLDYSTVGGTLSLYSWVKGNTSGAYGQVINNAATTMKLRSTSGRFQSGEGLTGYTTSAFSSTNGWTGTANSSQRLGWLEIHQQETTRVSTFAQVCNAEWYGSWYKLGTGTGGSSQTFTHYCSALVSGIWVQRGGVVTFTNGSATLTTAQSGFSIGNCVQLFNSGGSVATNFATATKYWVTSISPLQVAASPGGSAIVAGSAGSGTTTIVQVGETFTASGTTFTASTGHQLTNGTEVILLSSGTLPTGVDEFTSYYVVNANTTLGTFGLAATSGGAAISVSGGSGTHELLPISALERWCTLGTDAITTASTAELGNYFTQSGATITTGNGTNGNVVPNGSAVYVLNLNWCSATSGAPTVPSFSTSNVSNFAGLSSNNSETYGTHIAQGLMGSGFYWCAKDSLSHTLTNAAVLGYFDLNPVSQAVSGKNLIISAQGNSSNTVNLSNSSIDWDGIFMHARDANGNVFNASNSTIVLKNCVSSRVARTTNARTCYLGSNCSVTLTNCTAIGGLTTFTTSKNATITGHRYANYLLGGINTTNSQNLFSLGGANVVVDGLTILGNSPPRGSIFGGNDTDSLTIKNMGTAASPIALGGNPQSVITISSTTRIIPFIASNIWFSGFQAAGAAWINSFSALTPYYYFYDCGVGYDGSIINRLKFLQIRGCQVQTSLANFTSLIGVAGTHFADVFTSSTQAYALVQFSPKVSSDSTSNAAYTITSGTPVFDGSGNLLMETNGDQVIFECPYFVKGSTAITAMVGTSAINSTTGTTNANITADYDLDKGSGFSGTYKRCTTANLTAETGISASTGFRYRLKLTATATVTIGGGGNSLSNYMGFALTTDRTTLTTPLYPLTTTVTLKITNAVQGAHCVILRSSDNYRLMDTTADSSGTATTTYDYTTDTAVKVVVRLAGYVPYSVNTTITSIGLSVAATFSVDGAYAA